MDNVTQQNAALVEEASAASKSMEQQSTTLVSQIGYFRRADGSSIVSTAAEHHHHHRAPSAEVVRMAPTAVKTRAPVRKAGLAPVKPVKTAASPMARASGDNSSWSDF
jgi:methyl-accepting chemotaxis protein